MNNASTSEKLVIVHTRHASDLLSSLCLIGLAACGGGGGGGGGGSGEASNSAASSSAPAAAVCSNLDQLNFVRQHIDTRYLFYTLSPQTKPASYTGTPDAFFYSLTTQAIPATDRFSFVVTTAQAEAMLGSGTGTGLGLDTRKDTAGKLRIALVEPGSPAALAGLLRGDQITSINDSAVSGTLSSAQSNALYYSSAGTQVKIGFVRAPATAVQNVVATAASFVSDPVPVAKTFLSNGSKVGYIAFHEHTLPAEAKLADAFKKIASENVSDLVLDVRYNGGGYVFLAAQVGYMLAGANANKAPNFFQAYIHNDKQSAQNISYSFPSKILYASGRVNEALPTLNLKRIFLLTTGSSCSASESIISALRGVDVQVITVGKNTCGKPYGFYQTDYCGSSYFALEFKGANTKGDSVPLTGFTPTCAGLDDFDHTWGDPAEGLLATAMTYRNTGACPATAMSLAQSASADAAQLSNSNDNPRRVKGMSLLLPQ